MFTVKATYHGHTRKHTFSDMNTFPTYDQICNQLHRVFPITQNYYLSKLLFSPDAAQSSRILLSKEVHNAFDYHKALRQFKDRVWSHALLRFTVLDEIPAPLNNDARAETFRPTSSNVAGSGRSMSVSHVFQRPGVPPPMESSVSFHVGSGAIRGGGGGIGHQMPMDVDTLMPESSSQSNTHAPLQHQTPQQVSCCPVSQGKAEIKTMLHNFQEDLNRIMTNTFQSSMHSRPIPQADVGLTSAPFPFLCSLCTRHRQGTWYSCDNCHVVVCEACHSAPRPGFCLSVMGPHQMKLVPSPNSESYVPVPRLPVPWTLEPTSPPTQTGETSSVSSAVPSPPPVIHKGVACDVCNKIIEGIRHKCLDCPDYDLCSSCMTRVSEVHNPFHEMFEINEPGRVIVHTVFSGNGERESRDIPAEAALDPVIHWANCNLCDSRIRGDRYKCLDCPDFDSCVSCFSITNEQHPNHAFVKIRQKEDYIRRRNVAHVMHNAICNSCSKGIFGFRFKCMHPECPDYDLCENCEAFPIALHPSNHPMLKMKTPDTAIPTVYRVGQISLIEPTTVDNERQTSIIASRSPESTPSAGKAPFPTPSVPIHDVPAPPPVHARSSSHTEDMVRSCTPVTNSFLDHIVFEKTEARSNPTQIESPRSPPTPGPPKLPPKPDMISQQSWASIPDFFNTAPRPQYVPHNAFLPLPGQNTIENSQVSFGTIQPHEAQSPAPAIPTTPVPLHVPGSVPAPQVAHEDNDRLLPNVPAHTPNPWHTRNPSEREELLKLMVELSGFISAPPLRPVSPVAFSEPLKQPAAMPPRNNPFLTSPSNAVELPEAITSSVERPSAFEARPWVNDPLPSWASLTPDVSHSVEENFEQHTEPKSASIVSEPTSIVGSPLSGEALLNRPASSGSAASSSYPRSLAELIHQLPTLVPSKIPSPEKLPEARQALSAKFVDDVTVPDGQVFPPGAEFVKCWRILNTGERDWPENTELVFLAGDPLSGSALPPVPIGRVAAGAEVDVWTGELKAPDTPGRCVGYWKLKADGELFGNSLWIGINVVESDAHHSSDDSMAASSIIMPDASPSAQRSEHVLSTTVHSRSAVSTIVTDDNISDIGSDSSSASLISMPSSLSDDEDEALFYDSRSQIMPERVATTAATAATATSASGMDYVMLYDDNSSSEE